VPRKVGEMPGNFALPGECTPYIIALKCLFVDRPSIIKTAHKLNLVSIVLFAGYVNVKCHRLCDVGMSQTQAT